MGLYITKKKQTVPAVVTYKTVKNNALRWLSHQFVSEISEINQQEVA